MIRQHKYGEKSDAELRDRGAENVVTPHQILFGSEIIGFIVALADLRQKSTHRINRHANAVVTDPDPASAVSFSAPGDI
ncbi:MAG: hypothetical protein ACKPJD_20405, partial [Planctomycetaceae bacterium]